MTDLPAMRTNHNFDRPSNPYATRLGSEAMSLPAQPAGTELDVTVTARNATGESQPTGAVTAALP